MGLEKARLSSLVSLPLAAIHPLALELVREHPQSKPQDLPLHPKISLKDVRVLVIDDEPDACNLLKLLLESAGASVYLAQSADEGIEQLITKPVDVLICDIGMPGMDGYTLIRRVRTLVDPKKSEVPAVAVTAYAGLEDRTEAIRAGFQNHLPKPIEATELLAVVHSLVTPRSASRSGLIGG